jgi:hypothetical protein
MALGELISKRDALCSYEQKVHARIAVAKNDGDAELTQLLQDYAMLLTAMISEAEAQIAAYEDEE